MKGAKPKQPVRVLHCHSTFSAGGKERRAVELMNAFGSGIEHTVVSGMPEEMGARDLIRPEIITRFPTDFPKLTGRPMPGRLAILGWALKGFDLILTYNWGAMDAVLAHTLFNARLGLAPLVHHEDGFNQDEADQLKTGRNWYRRMALRGAHSVIVPSASLERIALKVWRQPRERVVRIPNGIDTLAFGLPPDLAKLPFAKPDGEFWVGTLAGLRPVKQLPALVDAFRNLPENWTLVIVGEGPERDAILRAAKRLGLESRVRLTGAVSDPASIVGLFDIFALSSKSEQFPLSVVEAMAAGLPVVAPAVGDIASIVAGENADFITPPGDISALERALQCLVADPNRRAYAGAANQTKARAQFDRAIMIERYQALYGGAAGLTF